MRYKIEFELPLLQQKHLQQAHSHFAFNGWVTFLLMVLMIESIKKQLETSALILFEKLFIAQLVISYLMLISFTNQGYGIISIIFSTISILNFILFSIYWKINSYKFKHLSHTKWLSTGIIFHLISYIGTGYLVYMSITHHFNQKLYLSSVYWFLHFQYNGWFLFCLFGLFISYLKHTLSIDYNFNKLFWIMTICCLPTFGLSILWIKIPFIIYLITLISITIQYFSTIYLIISLMKKHSESLKTIPVLYKRIIRLLILSYIFKLTLQFISIVPTISQWAFGFRPIVIAYLHLVLLVFTSTFLIILLLLNSKISLNKISKISLIFFIIFILINELLLVTQGVASICYFIINNTNLYLLVNSILILICFVIFFLNVKYPKPKIIYD